jgi:predicted NUDIX family NTP pyrophosphohydrolase
MPRISAGLLMYRFHDGKLQMLLAHPGGPFFKNKDDGAWSIPKGEIEPGEDLLEAAKREFKEETGITPTGPFTALTPIKQKGGKSFTPGRSRATAIPAQSSATRSRRNGPQSRGDRWSSLRSTGPTSST